MNESMYVVGLLKDPAASQKLRTLFDEDRKGNEDGKRLLSKELRSLTDFEAGDLKDPSRSLSVVAIDLGTWRYVCHASIHRMTTVAKGTSGHVELVVTHPEFCGQGVATKVMIALIRAAQKQWGTVRAIALTSRPARVHARTMYDHLGFVLHGEDRYTLELGDELWVSANGTEMDEVVKFDLQGRALAPTKGKKILDAIDLACQNSEDTHGVWSRNSVTPIVVCRYTTRV